MNTLQKNKPALGNKNRFFHLFLSFSNAVKKLFEPEEVEVTFKMDGNTTKYTYTVIDHHHAA